MPKTILITGAAGFLGSHLCDRFIDEGLIISLQVIRTILNTYWTTPIFIL